MTLLGSIPFVESENVGGSFVNPPTAIVLHYTVTRDFQSALTVLTKDLSKRSFGLNLLDDKLSAQKPSSNVIIGHHDGVVYYAEEDQGNALAAPSTPRVSSHFLVDTDGTANQLVPLDRIAWHAGKSSWNGTSGCNNFTIGIEMVNIGPVINGKDVYGRSYNGFKVQSKFGPWNEWAPYPIAQVDAVVRLCQKIVAAIPTIKEIICHSDISPGRKFDCGPAFPLAEVRQKVFGRSYTKVGDSILNLRSSELAGPVIAEMKPGCHVKILEQNGVWCKVQLEGWCHSNYLK